MKTTLTTRLWFCAICWQSWWLTMQTLNRGNYDDFGISDVTCNLKLTKPCSMDTSSFFWCKIIFSISAMQPYKSHLSLFNSELVKAAFSIWFLSLSTRNHELTATAKIKILGTGLRGNFLLSQLRGCNNEDKKGNITRTELPIIFARVKIQPVCQTIQSYFQKAKQNVTAIWITVNALKREL